ncbi:MAG TPA: hypothetical protein VGH76_00475 [Actinomycetospora sp.]|jgi:hypothetical protein|uniref:hypothetical protein n=1 Tax=Actinomycetospora sp. TaxID=1872135 RepID=UPI002F3E9705
MSEDTMQNGQADGDVSGAEEPEAAEDRDEGRDGGDRKAPDVYLHVPVLEVDEIDLEVEDLRAHVSLQAEVLDLVKLNVGVDASLGRVKLGIRGVNAQATLKVRLDEVAGIVGRVLDTIDRNPQILEHVTRGLGQATEEVGAGAGRAVEQLGGGASDAVSEVGSGAATAVGELGRGAGDAVSDVGEGAGEAVSDVGEGAGEAVSDVGDTVSDTTSSLVGTVTDVAGTRDTDSEPAEDADTDVEDADTDEPGGEDADTEDSGDVDDETDDDDVADTDTDADADADEDGTAEEPVAESAEDTEVDSPDEDAGPVRRTASARRARPASASEGRRSERREPERRATGRRTGTGEPQSNRDQDEAPARPRRSTRAPRRGSGER